MERTFLSDFGTSLRRYWVLPLLGAIIGGVASFGIWSVAEKTFQSTSAVLVASLTTDVGPVAGGRTSGPINMDTQAQIAKSLAVVNVAVRSLDEPTDPNSLASRVSIAVPPNTSVLRISVLAPAPEQAQKEAAAVSQAYLDVRQETAKRLHIAAGGGNKVFIDPGRIIEPAQYNDEPVQPKKIVFVVSGLALGLVIGCSVGFWRYSRRSKIKSASDLQEAALVSHSVSWPTGPDQDRQREDVGHRLSLECLGANGQVKHKSMSLLGLQTGAGEGLAGEVADSLAALGVTSKVIAVSASRSDGIYGWWAELKETRDSVDVVLVFNDAELSPTELASVARLTEVTVLVVGLRTSSRLVVRNLASQLNRLAVPVSELVAVEAATETDPGTRESRSS